MKDKFFITINDIIVFDQKKFVQFINNKEFLPDSYTALKNMIGLADNNNQFINESNDVVLDRPYKDCILAGGQDKEDAKRNEIFYNEVLWSDQIDRLLDPKVFTKFKKYSVNGELPFEDFGRNEYGEIKDNLIIKGNNLLALHSLKKQFAGKIKLIYIDPPYNTGSDSFNYNDKFNHSTWLTFMKNRIEIAKDLLRNDWVIFISCDDNELAYLTVLLDWIQDIQFESIFHCKVRHENRILRQDNRYQKVMEHLLCYSKKDFNPNRMEITKDPELDYQFEIRIKDNIVPRKEKIWNYEVEIYALEQYELIKSKTWNLKEYTISWSLITQKWSASEFYEKNLRQRKSSDWLWSLYKVKGMWLKGDGLWFRYIRQPFQDVWANGFYYQWRPISNSEDKTNPFPNYFDFEKVFNSIWEEWWVTFKNGKKPEFFLHKVFEIADLKKSDIVLDYHLWSWSTAWLSHKMNVQYIWIEQLESQVSLSLSRLNNAINWDQTGISTNVNRQGGWEFIYMEIAQNNEKLIQAIQNSKNTQDLISLYHQLKDSSFINYKININTIDASISEFEKLTLVDMKRFLNELIDKNALYINYDEMDDDSYAISEEDKVLNKKFYQ